MTKNISTLPWLLLKKQSKDVKEVLKKINFPTAFCSNIKNTVTKKGELGGLKTHDWHMFIKAIILVYIFVHW